MRKIPNYFHFVFGLKPQTEPFHLIHYLCIKSCIEINKPEKIYFHFKHLPYGKWWTLIKGHLILNEVNTSNFISSFEYQDPNIAKYRYAHISDIIRLEMLDKFGGIYADMDTLFIKPIPEHFFDKEYIMGKERIDYKQKAAHLAEGSLCNAWIASASGAKFGKVWLEKMKAEFDGSWSAHSTFLPYTLSKEYPENIHIEPEGSFFSLDWTRHGITDIFENNITVSAQSYSIHLWSHLWWSAKRNDVTLFHAGNVTPHYIKFASTTYSRLSARFLPEKAYTNRALFLFHNSLHHLKKHTLDYGRKQRALIKFTYHKILNAW